MASEFHRQLMWLRKKIAVVGYFQPDNHIGFSIHRFLRRDSNFHHFYFQLYYSQFQDVGICLVNLVDDSQEYTRGLFFLM